MKFVVQYILDQNPDLGFSLFIVLVLPTGMLQLFKIERILKRETNPSFCPGQERVCQAFITWLCFS